MQTNATLNPEFLNRYQEAALSTALYPPARALEYTVLGLCGEVGEIAAQVRDWEAAPRADTAAEALAELGDVCWYIATVSHTFDAKLSDLQPPSDKDVGLLEGVGLTPLVLAMAGHAGQIANKAKKVIRDNRPQGQIRDFVLVELAVVLTLAARVAATMGGDISQVMQANSEKLASRKARNVIAGDGDHR